MVARIGFVSSRLQLRALLVVLLVLSGPSAWARTKRTRSGFMKIDTTMVAHVWVDGRDTGVVTPTKPLRLRTGKHRVALVDVHDKSVGSAQVLIAAGQTATVKLEEPEHEEPASDDPPTTDSPIASAPQPSVPSTAALVRDVRGTSLSGRVQLLSLGRIDLTPAPRMLIDEALALDVGGAGVKQIGQFQLGGEARYNYSRSSSASGDAPPPTVQRIDMRARFGYQFCSHCVLAARAGYAMSFSSNPSPNGAIANQAASGPIGGLLLGAFNLESRFDVLQIVDAQLRTSDTNSTTAVVYTATSLVAFRIAGEVRALAFYSLSYEKPPAAHFVALGAELRFAD